MHQIWAADFVTTPASRRSTGSCRHSVSPLFGADRVSPNKAGSAARHSDPSKPGEDGPENRNVRAWSPRMEHRPASKSGLRSSTDDRARDRDHLGVEIPL